MKKVPWKLGNGAVLAPMAGVTNPPFRRICKELGASYAIAEMVSSHALCYINSKKGERKKSSGSASKTSLLIKKYANESPFCVQLFGKDVALMTQAAQLAVLNGADIIDLNFGCPARKIIKDGLGAGVALMKNPKLIFDIAKSIVDNVKVPVTVKIRTGWSQDEKNAPYIASGLENCGISAICIHGRTKQQVHSGEVDFKTIARVKNSVNIPVIGNGGVRSPEDARHMMETTGCDKVAIGQAARGNPFIFREIKGDEKKVQLPEIADVMKKHLYYYIEWAGQQRAVIEMRKHIVWYLKGFPGAKAVRKKLVRAKNIESYESLFNDLARRE